VKIKNTISKDTTIAYFDPRRQTILRTETSFNEGVAAALLEKDRQGHATKSIHDRNREAIQPNRERCIIHQMGQGETEILPSRGTKIPDSYRIQAIGTFVQQNQSKDASKDINMGGGDARRSPVF
jgi:Rps23 Pro-64 3,4-dihydroxylase Tpa1-like proline 4-hydroxylase